MTNERLNKIETVLSKRQPDLTIILENVFDPHNISAIMRNCDAVGIQEIYVLNTKLPLHKEWGFKSSRSALKWVTVHQFNTIEACIKDVKEKYKTILTTCLTPDAVSLYHIDFTGSVALVFGNEQHGISKEMSSCADGNFVIPQLGMLQSLNISVACAVTLYEAFRQRLNAGHYAQQKLSETSYNDLKNEWSKNGKTTL